MKAKLKLVLMVIGVYIVLSLITGSVLAAYSIAPVGIGFVLTAAWMVMLYRVIREDLH